MSEALIAGLGAPPDASQGAGEANSYALLNEPATRLGAGAAPTRRAARILAGCFVARQSKTTAGILLPRAAHPAKIRSSAAIPASDLVH
jgi:hypothetical protein